MSRSRTGPPDWALKPFPERSLSRQRVAENRARTSSGHDDPHSCPSACYPRRLPHPCHRSTATQALTRGRSRVG